MPPLLTTAEAMSLLRVKTRCKFNDICKLYGIKPVWRGGEGNVYLSDDFKFNTVDKEEDAFYDSVHG